ncbi:NAD(P)-dependent oxidoreductase [Ramlibacter tataouinensis]|uniref:3-hydroxyisobutyrate dehydrogenase-like protein n=1 Tax=Ramlibacter tataouinensis (strain ATCC BAA-407 / DSM 14655 / LMG 21543 / TTB310) TaxID=365046 RepID=F5XWA0_RAMTT|nr:NAD(P)-dependent oxidoreductase [Ramlibacter tataouinensis]AEG91670.1 3-hydroxyisobutyrate dehydrogenase-like protein [Ramlibacter tataouinensis TTB310]
MKVGIAGTGKMGGVVAARLSSLGHGVSVWNRTRQRAQPLLDSGLGWAASPRELAAAVDTVITFLTDEKALDEVYLSPSGLLSGSCTGKLFIEMSTVAPAKQQELASRAAAAGASYVECPVGGSVGPAREGKLMGFAGGAAQDVERARELLSQLCRRVEHVGPHGAGATMKLAVNLPLMVYWQTLGEALSLVQPLQLDPARVIDILSDSSGGPNMLKVRGGMIAQALAGDAGGAVTVDIATMHKDVQKMLELAGSLHRQLPLTARTAQSLRSAMDQGLAQADCAQLPVWWLKDAGRA